jgi:hypothetical protein
MPATKKQDKSRLFDFLDELDQELGRKNRKVTIIAVGGTAMTLLNLKPSTIDIDFDIPNEDYESVDLAIKMLNPGYRIDKFIDGLIFSQILPEDYIDKSYDVDTEMKFIRLKALHPLDIVVTKIGRLTERDLQDIEACIKKFKLSKEQIEERAKCIEVVGDENIYQANLKFILGRFF